MTKDQIFALRERALWKRLSSELSWTEELLAKYADKVDWEEVSSNKKVLWTESLLRRFADKLDWEELSKNDALTLLSPDIIRPFALYWHWDDKTENTAWTPKFIEEMKDHLDWKELYQAATSDEQEFYLKEYFDYVSHLPFDESGWRRDRYFDKYVDAHWKERAGEILSQVNNH